jgi:hypothetical protein
MKTIVNEATDIAKVKIKHYRVVSDKCKGLVNASLIPMGSFNEQFDKLNARGGLTVVELILQDGTSKFGVAACSLNDNFCKSIGRKRAYGRALTGKKMPMDTTLVDTVGLPEFVIDILKN